MKCLLMIAVVCMPGVRLVSFLAEQATVNPVGCAIFILWLAALAYAAWGLASESQFSR